MKRLLKGKLLQEALRSLGLERKDPTGIFLHEDERPMTRRDFLAAGLAQSIVAVGAPTVFDLIAAKKAHAENAPSQPTAPPFVILITDGAGGDAGASHFTFVPKTDDGGIPADQALLDMGLSPGYIRNTPGSTTTQYGPLMVVGPFTASLNVLLSQTIRNKLSFGVVQCDTPDDSPLGGQGLVAAALNAYLAMKYPSTYLIQGPVAAHPPFLPLNAAGLYSTSPNIVAAKHAEKVLQIKNPEAVRLAVGSPFFAMNPSNNQTTMYLNTNQAVTIAQTLETLAKRRKDRLSGGEALAGQRALAEGAENVFRRMRLDIPVGATINLTPTAVLHPSTLAILDNTNFLPNSGNTTADASLPADSRAEEIARFKAGLTAVISGACRPLLQLVMAGNDHHDASVMHNFAPGSDNLHLLGGTPGASLRRTLAYWAATINECAVRGIDCIIIGLRDGGMRASGGDGGGNTYVSDERRFCQLTIATYLHSARVERVRSNLGSAGRSNGFNSTNLIGSPAAAGAALFLATLHALGERDWRDWAKRIVPRSAVEGLNLEDLRMFNRVG